jgi:hypothetical protein
MNRNETKPPSRAELTPNRIALIEEAMTRAADCGALMQCCKAERGRRRSTGALLLVDQFGWAARRRSVHTQPIRDDFESGGRHCLFDVVVLAGRASFSVLQKMVHP